jgi:hypothetical protein
MTNRPTSEDLRRQLQTPEIRYVPLPHPEEVERWVRLAYLAGVEAGQLLKGGETS